MLTMASPQVAFAADCNSGFLGFPAWYRGLTKSPTDCDIKSPADSGGLSTFIWTIALNILEMVIISVAYLSGFFFLYGGFTFIMSRGKPESIVKAKSTISMSIIGLVVSIIAIAFVNFIISQVAP